MIVNHINSYKQQQQINEVRQTPMVPLTVDDHQFQQVIRLKFKLCFWQTSQRGKTCNQLPTNIKLHLRSIKHGGRLCHSLSLHCCLWIGSIIFIDDETHDSSSRVKAKVYRNIANLWKNTSKPIGRNLIMERDKDWKHTTISTKDFNR